MHNEANAAAGAAQHSRTEGLTKRLVTELEKFVFITLYLWLLFALFALHKYELLKSAEGVNAWQQGFAFINAVVFAKIIMLGQALKVGRRIEKHALLWNVLGKSLMFSMLLIVFHVAEESIRMAIRHEAASAAYADFGGSALGVLLYAAIFFVILFPFFAFQEASRVLGSDALWALLTHPGEGRFRLVEEDHGHRS
jgi:hypothetical protein